MAADAILLVKAQRNGQDFTTILTSTACEWFLIFLLLINAVISYLSTKFARYCQLQLPCIFCSRLDHVLGNEKPEFYRNLLCCNHRLEISSLVSCHIHSKLADGHDMCDDCLFSSSTKSNSNPEMHSLFLGKLGFDVIGCGPQSSLLNSDFVPVSMSKRLCSCCNKPWMSRKNMQRLLQLKSPLSRISKPNIPLPRRLNHRDGLKKIRDMFSGPAVPNLRVGKSTFDSLSQVGYSELKCSSDSESEFPFSDDDDGMSIIRDINEVKDDSSKPRVIKCSTPDVSSWRELGELNWQQPDQKTHPSPLPELISLDDISLPSNTLDVPVGVSPISQSFNGPASAELLSLVDMNPSFVVEIPISKAANVTGATDALHVSRNHHEEMLKLLNSTAGAGIESNVTGTTETQHISINHHEEISISGKRRETSGFVVEQPTEKEHDRVTVDSKLLLTQDSSAQEIPLSINNTSPNVQGHGDNTDAPSSSGIQNFQKSTLVERTDSAGLESLDGSTVSEIEGESTLDRLKRQLEYDKKCMNALYEELDEERSASAIAANQAMAMITRLQEEKAALHMEALQYLRMMEEQAEYDVEALEKANDLLAEKEKEMQDLEAELEYYRFNYPDESMETIYEKRDSKKENVNIEKMSLNHSKDDANIPCDSFSEVSKGNDNPNALIWSELENEKLYILQCLKSLESKLQRFAHNGTMHDISDKGYFEEEADVLHDQGEISDKDGTLISYQMEVSDLSVPKDLPLANGSPPSQEGSNASISKDQVVSKDNNHLVSNGKNDFMDCTKVDLVAIGYEISDLNERLDALEVDCNLLEHACNYLQNGNDGLQFIQQIAHQLQELRKIGMKSRCRSVP
ncbi:hypothetical protein Dsin_024925 [Dipteronia sinensis]|uniref:GTD-binding domain-containing protein n=1 Tax=Dipteronia sinensis TaxID=43782 RepID=A0AAD9ZUX1_9ROSI|nr:hypothetical protein Dsin_024925 [Dipteronia sinensis]